VRDVDKDLDRLTGGRIVDELNNGTVLSNHIRHMFGLRWAVVGVNSVILFFLRDRDCHFRLSREFNFDLTNIQYSIHAHDAMTSDQLTTVVGKAGSIGHERQ
jgi:hypothetical protein